MKQTQVLIWSVVGALSVWAAYRIYMAHADLVTLNVRNMDVRKLVPKLEWQTWEHIILNKDVSGAVTLNVRRVPLTDVLNIIGLQTASRWTAVFPIYSGRNGTLKLEKLVRGEIPPEGSGWSNLLKAPGWRGGGTLFGNAVRSVNNVVSAQFENKDLDFAALALSRFTQAQVVPEDGATAKLNLKLDQVPFTKAVAQVAKQAHRRWDKIYALQPVKPVVVAANAPTPGTNAVAVPRPADPVKTNFVQAPIQPDPADQQRQMEAFLATMTPQERQKAEEQIATMQQINSLPPGERQQKMQEMTAQAKQTSQADLESRVRKRLRDGSTDQRIAHDRELLGRQRKNP
jgi:hypothetical protein